MEVRVSRINSSDTMLLHQGSSMRIMQKVPGKVGDLLKQVFDDVFMLLSLSKHVNSRRDKQDLYKLPGVQYRPGFLKDFWMRNHSKKFVHNRPGEIPGSLVTPPAFKRGSTGFMKLRILIRRIH